MGTQLTDYAEERLLNHLVTQTPALTSGTVYLALFTATPSDAGGGTEVTGGSYARQSVAFDAAASRTTQNTSLITFPTATASWGTITHFALFDAVSGGNMLVWNALSGSVVIDVDDTFTVAAGDLDVSWDAGGVTTYLANELLDHLLGTGSYTQPTLYAALFTTATSDAGGGTEATGSAYARVQMEMDAAGVSGSTYLSDNTNEETFPTASGGNWGTIGWAALFDASSGGNMLYHGALDATKDVNDGDTFKFLAGEFNITMD